MDEASLSALPGYEIYREGLEAILSGNFHSESALLIAMAEERLQDAGLPLPPHPQSPQGNLEFYNLLAARYPDAHYRYNASLQRLDKFCRAVERLNRT
jgi:hypothetical protein